MMRRVRWSSHGWSHGKTPNSFTVGRETYSDLQRQNLQRKSRNSAWWEEHLIPQLTKQDPNVFLYGNGDSPNFSYCFPGKEREKECMVGGDFSSHVQSLGMTPDSLSLVTATYSAPISVSLQKRKKKHLMRRWHSLSSHGKPIFLWLGKEDSPNSLALCPGKGRKVQR